MKTFNAKKIILMIADVLMISVFGFITNLILMWFDLGTLASEGSMLQINWSTLTLVIAVEMLFCFFTLYVSGTYSFFWRLLGKHEYLSCFIGLTAGMMLSVGFLAFFGALDESSPAVFFVLQYLFTGASMMLFRYYAKKAVVGLTEAGRSENYQRTLIIGAGRAATLLLTDIENAKKDPANPSGNMLPVGLVDDDRSKLGSKILGVPVLGGTVDIPALCEQSHISLIVFAIPSCTEEDRQRILSLCSKTQCKIKMVPYLSQLLFEDGGHPQLLNQVKDIHIEDLLGREPITFSKEQTKEFIKDKVLMVTGGGGSIGSELVRQIAKYNPRQVIIVDIYENNAYDIQQELILEYGDEVDFVTLIASVRDFEKMNLIFEKYRPQVVFHAAAHKHVPLMETSPEEAVKNNVFGTFNIAKLAENYGVEKFIMISTDKAVNPTNVMGATKRCCEMIVQYMSQHAEKTDFVTTRFGNVLGSNGSVIPLFRRQIESGKPVTVTHPDIIRYFMTIPEAVSLVLQAGAMAQGGEIFVLDMGEPVKITTLAENLIRMYGKVPYRDVEIKFTGLRPGEKLFEELLMNEEGLKSTENKKIFIGNQISIDEKDLLEKLEQLKTFADDNNSEGVVQMLGKIVPTFNHKTNK
ncbi:MAG: polysaccharide biosynthesis protein [Ruminococcaceae bacterium]|nr:polysaccharide biosynthesis protein [Oscillospiraceae bacterium]